jgi:hypothetical protein
MVFDPFFSIKIKFESNLAFPARSQYEIFIRIIIPIRKRELLNFFPALVLLSFFGIVSDDIGANFNQFLRKKFQLSCFKGFFLRNGMVSR